MADKQKKNNIPTNQQSSAPVSSPVAAQWGLPAWIRSFGVQAFIVAVLAISLYWNTFRHEYALDDTIVIVNNEFVHKGVAGIPDILTKDAYYSYYAQLGATNQVVGGRYRPLSIVTFAIEQQLFGPLWKNGIDSVLLNGIGYVKEFPYERKFIDNMHTRHVVNVLFYALAGIALLWFLRSVVFRENYLAAFIAAIIFIVHPLHTEVVDNVKSRDEIMSLLFICLTFVAAFRYLEQKKILWLLSAIAAYFLAFLSKEYAITLVVLLPLAFCLFGKRTIGQSLKETLPYFIVVVIYGLIRWNMLGPRSELADNDIQVNPYALATPIEKLASEIATSLNYLKLLIFPHPLSSDYSFNQIPYRDFGSALVWLSIVVHIGLVIAGIYLFKKRHVLSFAIAFYLLNLLLVNNLLFDIGATMGERLIFHSSVGFAVAVAYLLHEGLRKIETVQLRNVMLTGSMVVLVGLFGFTTIQRNPDWKNDETLFFHDVNVSPNSFLVNVNVGVMLINRSDYEKDPKVKRENLERGVKLLTRAMGMVDNYVLGYLNRSIAYLKLEDPDNMMLDLERINVLYPKHPKLPEMYYHAGILCMDKGRFVQAAEAFRWCVKLDPRYPDGQNMLNIAMSKVQPAAQ